MALLALALSAYRTEHGEYPKTLAELAPTYIDAILKDPFTDGEFYYKQEGDGYLLYSVGRNGKDDGGRNYMHGSRDETGTVTEDEMKSWDDIAIRTPPKKPSPKP